jgi:hypothetical protein
MTKLLVEEIAEVCHEANRALCKALGDRVLPAWGELGVEHRVSTTRGVRTALADPSTDPAASHEAWRMDKVMHGWTYGPETNDEAKTHKNMLTYADLPIEQKMKDHLFLEIIRCLDGLL